MVDLYCPPFVDLIDRMRLEHAHQESIFDLPAKKWYRPSAEPGAADLSVRFHDQVAGNPVGPASGPQTQMAQNLVLSWLAGARIMELKTVQVDDCLTIGRPCIDATNVGYNIEFSQELLVQDSLEQYVQGAMLIHMLRHAPEQFGRPFGDTDLAGIAGETVYDMSIGYDLAGIRSNKVRGFIESMMDASKSLDRWRQAIPTRLKRLRDLDYPTCLSSSITLSTFHGCPADEIERICEFLIRDVGVNCIVKMNPPMLGREKVEYLLHDVMGYDEVQVNPTAYTSGLQFDESIQICDRLRDLARHHGLSFGAKFSNTLETINHRDFFSPQEKVMYLSGPPLHVITLTLAWTFRQLMGPEFPISFSAGVDRKNFANLVACGFTPITTCTDLLKPGGYGRLPAYLHDLTDAMAKIGSATVGEYILDVCAQREAAGDDPIGAGYLNTPLVVERTQADPRYRRAKNSAVPKRIDSHLEIFDCITCNKCIPVCPNDANFLYETPEVDCVYRDVEVAQDGSVVEVGEQRTFQVQRQQQIANFADFCNHCGNCDTFCPEYDGPYIKKPSFFGSRRAFDEGKPHDGFYLEGEPGALVLHGRIEGQPCRLEEQPQAATYCYFDGTVRLLIDAERSVSLHPDQRVPDHAHRVDLGRFHLLLTLLGGIVDGSRVHQVNVRFLDGRPGP